MTFLPLLLFLSQEPLRFDAVSVRPDPPPAHFSLDFDPVKPGGKYLHPSTALLHLIGFAHNVRNASLNLTGLPGWAKDRNYAISATAGSDYPTDLSPAENQRRVQAMLRTMLEERFRLKMHAETKQEQLFELHTTKQGFQFPAVDPPVPPAKEGRVSGAMSNAVGTIVATKGTMTGMRQMLEVFLKRTVLDKTGLTGYYDFEVKWESPNPTEGFGPEGIAMLISTLRSKFGLELKATRGPVTYWVVDRIEPPSEN